MLIHVTLKSFIHRKFKNEGRTFLVVQRLGLCTFPAGGVLVPSQGSSACGWGGQTPDISQGRVLFIQGSVDCTITMIRETSGYEQRPGS